MHFICVNKDYYQYGRSHARAHAHTLHDTHAHATPMHSHVSGGNEMMMKADKSSVRLTDKEDAAVAMAGAL